MVGLFLGGGGGGAKGMLAPSQIISGGGSCPPPPPSSYAYDFTNGNRVSEFLSVSLGEKAIKMRVLLEVGGKSLYM